MKNNNPKTVEYHGKMCTLNELSMIHGVPVSSINNRLRYGWDIETAISKPVKRAPVAPLPVEFQNENIVEVVFRERIGVFNHMQPRLNKRYILTAHTSAHMNPVYTITLENGKILIVYPEEYEIVNVIPRATVAEAC